MKEAVSLPHHGEVIKIPSDPHDPTAKGYTVLEVRHHEAGFFLSLLRRAESVTPVIREINLDIRGIGFSGKPFVFERLVVPVAAE